MTKVGYARYGKRKDRLALRREARWGKVNGCDFGYYERILDPNRPRWSPEFRPGWAWDEEG